jgi:hypothetical protein
MKNFSAGTFSGVSKDKIEKNILTEGKHPLILILRQLRRNSIFFGQRYNLERRAPSRLEDNFQFKLAEAVLGAPFPPPFSPAFCERCVQRWPMPWRN